MPPVEISSNGNPLDLTSKARDRQPADQADTASMVIITKKTPVSSDTFTVSDRLDALSTLSVEPSAQEQAAQQKKLDALKTQYTAGTLPLQSSDDATRRQAAERVAEKLIEFEKQLGKTP